MNLVPILSLCNIGAKLYSPICGDCRLSKLNLESDYPISVEAIDNRIFSFNKEGKLYNTKEYESECLLFPAKNTSWIESIKNSSLSIMASLEGLSQVDIKTRDNNIEAVTGFRDFNHVKEIANKYGLKIVSLERPGVTREMMIMAYSISEPIKVDRFLYSSCDPKNAYMDHTINDIKEYDFIDENVIEHLKKCETFEELNRTVSKYKELYDNLKCMKNDEILIVKNGEYFNTVKRQTTNFEFNGILMTIGLIK